MRLPRVNLRMPRFSLDWLGEFISRTVVLYAAFTAVLFLIFLIVNFPHDVVVRRVINRLDLAPLRLDFSSARFAWHRGYELRGVRLSEAQSRDGRLPLLEVTKLDVRPELLPLVRGDLSGLLWDGQLYGGRAVGFWKVTGNGGNGAVELEKLQIGLYRTLTALLEEGQLSGQLSGSFVLELGGADGRTAQASGDVSVLRPGLTGAKIAGFTVPDLQFGQIRGKLGIKGDRIDVQNLQATGDQLNVQVNGSILTRTPFGASRMNLQVTLEQSAATPDSIKTLIALIPRSRSARPGAPITISGTLASPQIR